MRCSNFLLAERCTRYLYDYRNLFPLSIPLTKYFFTVVIYIFNVKWLKEVLNGKDFMAVYPHSEWNMLVVHTLTETNPQQSAYKKKWKKFPSIWMSFSAEQMELYHLFDRRWKGRYPYTKRNSFWLIPLTVCHF